MRLRFADFDLDEANALLTRGGVAIALPPKAFSVLCTLARQPGQLTRKDALLDAVWGHRHVSESVLKTTVSQVRAALEDNAAEPRYIETVSRHGYRFIGKPQAAIAQAAAIAQSLPASSQDGSTVDLAPMIGRQVALTRLKSAWQSALAGKRQLAWIVGEPGIGKTTLIETFLRDVQPVIIARGQCVDQHGAGEPYRPVLEALGSLCRQFPELPTLMRAVAPTWLVQFPWLSSAPEREALQRELSGITQDRMLREIVELMERFTPEHPFVFVTEDLHWSDPATLRLLDHYARRRSPLRLLWLASFRLSQALAEEHPLVPIRHELRLHQLCEELPLDAFSEREVADYVAQRLPGAESDEAFVRRLHAHTDGLPLFIANVVDTLLAQRPQTANDPAVLAALAQAPLPISENLTAAIERQIVRLAPATCSLLEAASVCGQEFGPTLLADLLGRDSTAVAACCDELAREQYWLRDAGFTERPDGALEPRVAFRHALFRHAFYQRQSSAQRVQGHRRLARALEPGRTAGLATTAAEIASHFELGHEPLPALKYYGQAAASAISRFAPPEALTITERAMPLLGRCPPGNERLEIELGLMTQRAIACAQLESMGSARATEAFARVREICSELPMTAQRALFLGNVGWVYYIRGEFDAALDLAASIEALSATNGDPALLVSACNLIGLARASQGRHAEACAHYERGLAACLALGDALPVAAYMVDPETSMRTVMAMPLMALGRIDEARAESAAAIVRGARCGQPFARGVSHKCAIQLALRLGEIDRAEALLADFQHITTTLMVRQAAGAVSWFRGIIDACRGDPKGGYAKIRAGYDLHVQRGILATCSEVLAYAVEARLLDGNVAGAERDLEEAFALCRRFGEYLYLPELHLLDSRVRRLAGDAKAAREALDRSIRVAREQQALFYEIRALSELARVEPAPEHRESLQDALTKLRGGDDLTLRREAQVLLAT